MCGNGDSRTISRLEAFPAWRPAQSRVCAGASPIKLNSARMKPWTDGASPDLETGTPLHKPELRAQWAPLMSKSDLLHHPELKAWSLGLMGSGVALQNTSCENCVELVGWGKFK